MSPRRSTQRYEFIRIIRFFEGGIGVAKIAFYLDWAWGNIFCWLFSRCLFFLFQGENYTGKKLAEPQSVKIQVNSREIQFRKKVGKMKQKVDTRRLIPKSGKVDMLSITQNSATGKHGKRFEDIKISYGWQVGSHTSSKNISNVWNVGQVDIGQLWYGTSLVQYFGSSKFSDK